jgi:hypothetical protein
MHTTCVEVEIRSEKYKSDKIHEWKMEYECSQLLFFPSSLKIMTPCV